MYEPGRQYAAVAAACFERDETPVNLEALVHGDRSGGGGGARVTAGVHFS